MICTLLRKPLFGNTLGSLPCGVLHIDASRIPTAPWDAKAMERVNSPGSGRNRATHGGRETPEGRWDGPIGTGVMDTTKGRFPANLILTHLGECQLLGSKRVKANQSSSIGSGRGPNQDPSVMSWGKGGVVQRGTAEPAGKETVESWQCVDGCFVKMLDEQSGNLTSGSVKVGYMRNGSKQPSRGGFEGGLTQDFPLMGYGDSGGASRFFKQVGQ